MQCSVVLDPTTNKLTSAYHRRAFEHYFKHVIDFDESHHLLWAQLNAVYQASHPLFLDTIALTLSVTIETLLSSEFPKLGMPTPGELRYIEKIKQYVKEWNGDPTVKQRVVGSISQMHTSRAGDKLYALVRKGVITEDQYKHWKKLRNASAHSFQSGTLTNQELLELVQHVQMLFYHLVFHAIGYKGLYLDFDTPGWPLKSYPP